MTQDEINKAFENRWRIKGNFGQMNQNAATMSFDEYFEYIKGLCRDFFEAGAYIAQASVCNEIDPTTPTVTISTVEEANAFYAEKDFEYWWDLYGKKIDRGKCEKKWKKLSPEERTACIEATPVYVASTPDLQFRRNPMTYLNNRSWENQIILHNGTNQPTIEQKRKSKLANILTD